MPSSVVGSQSPTTGLSPLPSPSPSTLASASASASTSSPALSPPLSQSPSINGNNDEEALYINAQSPPAAFPIPLLHIPVAAVPVESAYGHTRASTSTRSITNHSYNHNHNHSHSPTIPTPDSRHQQPTAAATTATTAAKLGERMALNTLPYDILLSIVAYLNLYDIRALHLTCRSLYGFTTTRPVYRRLATDLLRRCRALPLKGFQRLSDLNNEQLMRSVNRAARYEVAWRVRAPRPLGTTEAPWRDSWSNYMDDYEALDGAALASAAKGTRAPARDVVPVANTGFALSALTTATAAAAAQPKKNWYRVVSAPPGEEVDWLSPITSNYTLSATKSGKVVCWDVQTDKCLAEWVPGERWDLWKCRVVFELKTVFFTMARALVARLDDGRVMEFILMKLLFFDHPSGLRSPLQPPVFSRVTSFKTSGVVMNVFLLDPDARLLSAFVWVERTNTIGLFALLDWDEREYVFVDTGIDCLVSSNWSCILYSSSIVIHCEESDSASQHFYPLALLAQHRRPYLDEKSTPVILCRLTPYRSLTKRFGFPKVLDGVHRERERRRRERDRERREAYEMAQQQQREREKEGEITRLRSFARVREGEGEGERGNDDAGLYHMDDEENGIENKESELALAKEFFHPEVLEDWGMTIGSGDREKEEDANSDTTDANEPQIYSGNDASSLSPTPRSRKNVNGKTSEGDDDKTEEGANNYHHHLARNASSSSPSLSVSSQSRPPTSNLSASSTSASTFTNMSATSPAAANGTRSSASSSSTSSGGGGYVPPPMISIHIQPSQIIIQPPPPLPETITDGNTLPPPIGSAHLIVAGVSASTSASSSTTPLLVLPTLPMGPLNAPPGINLAPAAAAHQGVPLPSTTAYPGPPLPPALNPNPFPFPPWYPENAHFVRQWWPTIPTIPRVSCTVVLLTKHDVETHKTRYILAQHYFRVPISKVEWRRLGREESGEIMGVPVDAGAGGGRGRGRGENGAGGGGRGVRGDVNLAGSPSGSRNRSRATSVDVEDEEAEVEEVVLGRRRVDDALLGGDSIGVNGHAASEGTETEKKKKRKKKKKERSTRTSKDTGKGKGKARVLDADEEDMDAADETDAGRIRERREEQDEWRERKRRRKHRRTGSLTNGRAKSNDKDKDGLVAPAPGSISCGTLGTSLSTDSPTRERCGRRKAMRHGSPTHLAVPTPTTPTTGGAATVLLSGQVENGGEDSDASMGSPGPRNGYPRSRSASFSSTSSSSSSPSYSSSYSRSSGSSSSSSSSSSLSSASVSSLRRRQREQQHRAAPRSSSVSSSSAPSTDTEDASDARLQASDDALMRLWYVSRPFEVVCVFDSSTSEAHSSTSSSSSDEDGDEGEFEIVDEEAMPGEGDGSGEDSNPNPNPNPDPSPNPNPATPTPRLKKKRKTKSHNNDDAQESQNQNGNHNHNHNHDEEDDFGGSDRPRPLVAVDFGHAVWVEYVDPEVRKEEEKVWERERRKWGVREGTKKISRMKPRRRTTTTTNTATNETVAGSALPEGMDMDDFLQQVADADRVMRVHRDAGREAAARGERYDAPVPEELAGVHQSVLEIAAALVRTAERFDSGGTNTNGAAAAPAPSADHNNASTSASTGHNASTGDPPCYPLESLTSAVASDLTTSLQTLRARRSNASSHPNSLGRWSELVLNPDQGAKWLRFVTFPPYNEYRLGRRRREKRRRRKIEKEREREERRREREARRREREEKRMNGKGKQKATELDDNDSHPHAVTLPNHRHQDHHHHQDSSQPSDHSDQDPRWYSHRRSRRKAQDDWECEGRVRTLDIPEELDLDTVETINIDQSQGAVILSTKEGKIFILCYE